MQRNAIVKFPEGFIWGTATAAYQIEGAAAEDGRGQSIWDVFSHTSGKIKNNETGDVACNHYHRLDEDLDLIAALIPNYRFSIAWPRIIPDGIGQINQKGVDFYNRLIDGLLERNVTPWVTMFHWDLPQALQEKGGWTNREIISWFEKYAEALCRNFGDRVSNWIIFNEPSVYSWIGHGLGFHAPGLADENSYLACAHNTNRAIGHIYRYLKDYNSSLNVGSSYQIPKIISEPHGTQDHILATMDALWNRNHLDPLFLGKYPEVMSARFEPYIETGDMELCRTPLDFIGIQNYSSIEAGEDKNRIFETFFGSKNPDTPKTDYGWNIDPAAFYDCLMEIKQRYKSEMPILVTENGAVFTDKVINSRCNDPKRISYLNDYIKAMHKAIQDGAHIKGYFVWSLMDNFEWSDGYDYRFGLIHIDYDTKCRTPKDSYFWYQKVAESNSLPAEKVYKGETE